MADIETTTVAALAVDRYGGPERLRLTHVDSADPGQGEVQIETHAVALNRSDLLAMRGEPFFMRLGNGLTRPRRGVPGSDVAGRVVKVGAGVDRLVVGDAVVADLSDHGRGGLAERLTVKADALVSVPGGLSLAAASVFPTAGVTAFQALSRIAGLQAGERVLVDGASGGVGGFAIQLAKVIGAHVTAVVGHGKEAAARLLGADEVVDYTQSDPTDPTQISIGQGYDVIYAVNGHRNLSEYQRVMTTEGRLVMTGGSGALMLQTMLGGKRYRFHTMKSRPDDLEYLLELAASGQLLSNIVARYPLSRAVEALTQLEQGHAAGKIVITMNEGEE
jgi:NADPH:quinone reductase-like Zn-dependent oxidoreductase